VFFNEFSTNLEVFIKTRNLSVSNHVIKKSPFSCVVPFLLTFVVIAHIQVLFDSFVAKSEALKLFSIERQLISSSNKNRFPCC
jgi:hypothetical protein